MRRVISKNVRMFFLMDQFHVICRNETTSSVDLTFPPISVLFPNHNDVIELEA